METFINDFFGKPASPSNSPVKESDAKKIKSDVKPGDVKPGMTKSDKLFMKDLMMGMAGVINTQIVEVKEQVSSHRSELDQLKSDNLAMKKEIKELRSSIEKGIEPGTEKKFDAVDKRLDNIEKVQSRPPGLSSSASNASTAYSENDPELMVLGSLGEGLLKEEAENVAREILTQLNLLHYFSNIYGPGGFNTTCVLRIKDTRNFMKIQKAVRDAEIRKEKMDSDVWFNLKLSKIQRAPNKILKEMMKQTQAFYPDTANRVVRCNMSKAIYYYKRDQCIGSVCRETAEWQWGSFGSQHIPEDMQRKWVAAADAAAGLKRH